MTPSPVPKLPFPPPQPHPNLACSYYVTLPSQGDSPTTWSATWTTAPLESAKVPSLIRSCLIHAVMFLNSTASPPQGPGSKPLQVHI